MYENFDVEEIVKNYNGWTIRRAFKVWIFFVEAFGKSFAKTYGVESYREWLKVIDKLSDDEVSYGLDRILNANTPHVPTIQEFTSYCKEDGNPELVWKRH